jgi:hypothetical protein
MEKAIEHRKTLGQAIDEINRALEPLDESTRLTAIRAVCDHLKINLSPSISQSASPSPPGPPTPAIQGAPSSVAVATVDIRTLKEQKQPSSANEMAALVAYYLAEVAPEGERTQEVTKEHMAKYFKQAGYPLPRVIRQLLPNAKSAGYFDSAGEGKFRLNPVGYNLVAHNLPRSGAATQPATAKRRPRRPRQARKKV